jgi:glycosyltransferase involved in cell wall biosynthesis
MTKVFGEENFVEQEEIVNGTNFLVQVTCMTYNHVNYITDAMDGFVMQQTSFPFVCIIVDDASADGEPDVIKKYLNDNFDRMETGLATEDETDEYLRIYARHKENKNCRFCVLLLKYNHHSIGKPKTSSLAGLTKTVKYVALCEGDDYWTDPLKLQKQVDYMEEHDNCVCAAHNSLKLDTNTRQIKLFNNKLLQKKDYTLESFITRDWFTPTQSLLYRRDCCQVFEGKPAFMHGDYSLLINVLLPPGSYLHYENDIMSVYRAGGWASTHFNEIDLYNDFIALLEFYKQKSNHRCDAVFDKQIERQKLELDQYVKYQKESRKMHSLFVRAGHWLCRFIALVVNKYVPCIQVEKKLRFRTIPNLEQLE